MKTKYVIHGGFISGQNKDDNFYKEILSNVPYETKILLVYFAKEADRVAKNREEDIQEFSKNSGGKVLKFETADEISFLEQVNKSDVIYLHGGHSGLLLEALKKYPNLKAAFKGKIIAGDSAGANVLAEAFYSQKIGVAEGFGLLPFKLICHFKEENKDKLTHIKPDLETIFLPEYKTKVMNI